MAGSFTLFALGVAVVRASLILVFLPIPGFRLLPVGARALVAFSMATVIAGAGTWAEGPAVAGAYGFTRLMADLFTAAGIGLAGNFVVESLTFGAQMIAAQAGFSYASMIDPFSESDTGIIPSFVGLAANLLIFQSPLYAGLFRALAEGLSRAPERAASHASDVARIVVGFSAHCLEYGIRLALPVIAFGFLADLCIGLFGRLQPQIQFLPISFSLKLLGALTATAAVLPALGWLHQRLSATAGDVLLVLTR